MTEMATPTALILIVATPFPVKATITATKCVQAELMKTATVQSTATMTTAQRTAPVPHRRCVMAGTMRMGTEILTVMTPIVSRTPPAFATNAPSTLTTVMKVRAAAL